jgi:hypothetical protein
MKEGLSIIIPFVLENPQVQFTVRALSEQLSEACFDWEIIVVNNYCSEVQAQQKAQCLPVEDDQGGNHLKSMSKNLSWLMYLEYTKKLSHWQCKNLAVEKAQYKTLFFLDSHCLLSLDALSKMYIDFTLFEKNKDSSYHLPITYHILEEKRLIYKLVADVKKSVCGYSFTSNYIEPGSIAEVPCMSTCGMMIKKETLLGLGAWPKELGIYSGGEQFINFAMAVCGYKKYIFNKGVLHHHGAKRKYHWNFDDFHRNNAISAYLFGGKNWAINHHKNSKASHCSFMDGIFDKCKEQRSLIKEKQVVSIERWIKKQC